MDFESLKGLPPRPPQTPKVQPRKRKSKAGGSKKKSSSLKTTGNEGNGTKGEISMDGPSAGINNSHGNTMGGNSTGLLGNAPSSNTLASTAAIQDNAASLSSATQFAPKMKAPQPKLKSKKGKKKKKSATKTQTTTPEKVQTESTGLAKKRSLSTMKQSSDKPKPAAIKSIKSIKSVKSVKSISTGDADKTEAKKAAATLSVLSPDSFLSQEEFHQKISSGSSEHHMETESIEADASATKESSTEPSLTLVDDQQTPEPVKKKARTESSENTSTSTSSSSSSKDSEKKKKRKKKIKAGPVLSNSNPWIAYNGEMPVTERKPKNPGPSLGPQFIINDKGEWVIDKSSLEVVLTPEQLAAGSIHNMGNDPSTSRGKGRRGASSRRNGLTKWTVEETADFYTALRMCGTDFSRISDLLVIKDRKAVKRKYKREERDNENKITRALEDPLEFDPKMYSEQRLSSID